MSDTATKVDLFAGLPPIFRDVAGDSPMGKYKAEPFTIGAYVYATDGRMACRASLADVPDYVPTDNKGPAADKVFELVRTEGEVVLGDLPAPRREECPNCDRDGEVECNYGHVHQCPYCEGSTQIMVQPPDVQLGDFKFSGRLLWLVRKHGFRTIKLPAKKIEPNTRSHTAGGGGTFAFLTHAGIEVVIVPLNPPQEHA